LTRQCVRDRWVYRSTVAVAFSIAAVSVAQTPDPAPVFPSPVPATEATAQSTDPSASLETVTVSAPEPRYVAPTLRDRIGRIWAPVFLNNKGPYRLVLDTGANRSALIPRVADELGESVKTKRTVRVRGVSGTAMVPLVRVDRMDIGDLVLEPAMLPVVADVFGGADGILGNEGMRDKRISIDFKRDVITVKRSKREMPGAEFRTLPINLIRGHLLSVDVMIGKIKTTAIIDTGSSQSLGNNALLEALKRMPEDKPPVEVVGVTLDVQYAERVTMPTIRMDEIVIRGAQMSFGDVYIFQYWRLTDEPAILLGMDVIGVVEQMIIDYRTKQLHIKIRR
jgi:hypothetical protein